MKATRILVTGRVQGVGFRFHTERLGRALGLRGFVRNLPDGRVEAVAAGPRDRLDRFLAELRHGPRGARVDELESADAELDDGVETFLIRP